MNKTRLSQLIGLVLSVLVAASLVLGIDIIMRRASIALAASFAVNSTADASDANPGDGICETAPGNGICTLRAAIQEANALAGGDTISIPAGTFTLTNGTLSVMSDMTISGAGSGNTIIKGVISGSYGVFYVTGTVTISSVTIRDGQAFNGGGIRNDGSLTLQNSVVTSNTAPFGGGILSNGTLIIRNTSITGNSGSYGAGIQNTAGYGAGVVHIYDSTISRNVGRNTGYGTGGGGILVNSTATISNTTIFSNSVVGSDGGGVLVGGYPGAILTMTNVTFSGNSASGVGGSLANYGNTAVLVNTILANGTPSNCSGPITSLGYNLDSGNSCGFTMPGDITNTNPLLGPLANNGGPTLTMALLPDSPAIDKGNNIGCPGTDQRGVTRPLDGNHDGVAQCDIGAYEFDLLNSLYLPLVMR